MPEHQVGIICPLSTRVVLTVMRRMPQLNLSLFVSFSGMGREIA